MDGHSVLQSMEALRQQVEKLTQQLNDIQEKPNDKTLDALKPSDLDNLEDPTTKHVMINGVLMPYDDSIHILTGPVIGKVTHTTAIILLEVDTNTKVTINVFCKGNLRKQFSQDMPANKAKCFVVSQLDPQLPYQVVFSGINKTDMKTRTGKFNTLSAFPTRMRVATVSCDKPEALLEGENNMWEKLAMSVSKGEVDLICHIGNQVYATDVFEEAWALYRRHDDLSSIEETEAMEELVRNKIRDIYRFTWNLPCVRQVLASVPHLTIWGDNDIVKAFTIGGLAVERTQTLEPRMIQLAREVYHEYQRQLWDPLYDMNDTCNEFHFHVWGQIGIAFVDMRGNFIASDGNILHDKGLISMRQWAWIDELLMTNGLKCLLLCTEQPPVLETIAECINLSNTVPEVRSHWAFYSTELVRLLDTLFMWKKALKGREIVIASGGARLGLHTQIHDTTTMLSIEQLVASPITDSVQPFAFASVGKLTDRFTYKHTPLQSQRNYGVINLHASLNEGGRSEVQLVGSYDITVQATLGPVIGNVTPRSVVILLEVYSQSSVTCVVTDTSSGKRHTSSQVMPEGRPKPFIIDTLDPGRTYSVEFMGISNPEEHKGSFCTPKLEPTHLTFVFVSSDRVDKLMAGEVNMWKKVHSCTEQKSVNMMVHLGGQVYANKAFDDAWTLLRRNLNAALTDQEREASHEQVRGLLRNVYRFTWNLPHTKEVLSQSPHLMVWSDKDIYPNFTNTSRHGVPVSPTMLKLAVQVYQEYQRALWDTSPELGTITDEYSFHSWGSVAILTLDLRGNKINNKGESMPDNMHISGEQWAFIEKVLRSQKLKVIIICCEYPFIADRPEDANAKLLDEEVTYNFWPCHRDLLCRLLALLFDWQGALFRDRKVLMVGGGQIGADSVILDSKTNLEIQHITVGPVSDTPLQRFSCQLEGTLSPRFSYVHRPREGQRNFCVTEVTVEPKHTPTINARLVTDREQWAFTTTTKKPSVRMSALTRSHNAKTQFERKESVSKQFLPPLMRPSSAPQTLNASSTLILPPTPDGMIAEANQLHQQQQQVQLDASIRLDSPIATNSVGSIVQQPGSPTFSPTLTTIAPSLNSSSSNTNTKTRPSSAPIGGSEFAAHRVTSHYYTSNGPDRMCPVAVNGRHKLFNNICKLCGCVLDNSGKASIPTVMPSGNSEKDSKDHTKRVLQDLDDYDVDFDRQRMKIEYLRLIQTLEYKDRDSEVKATELVASFKDKEHGLITEIGDRDQQIKHLQDRVDFKTTTIKQLQQKNENLVLTTVAATSAVPDITDVTLLDNNVPGPYNPGLSVISVVGLDGLVLNNNSGATVAADSQFGESNKGGYSLPSYTQTPTTQAMAGNPAQSMRKTSYSHPSSTSAARTMALSSTPTPSTLQRPHSAPLRRNPATGLPANLLPPVTSNLSEGVSAFISEDKLQAVFGTLDVNGQGWISKNDFQTFYEQVDPFGANDLGGLTKGKGPAWMKTVDDSKVTYEEFAHAMLKVAAQ